MLKKIRLVFIVLTLVIIGLQMFGDRDFSQLTIAVDKFNHGQSFSELIDDISLIFAGESINQGGLDSAKMADRIIYRWTDAEGIVHNSERMPKVEKFEAIRLGDLKIETQEALGKEEIKKALR